MKLMIKENQISFLKIIHTIVYDDDQLTTDEKYALFDVLHKQLFPNVEESKFRIHLQDEKEIAQEIDKIEDVEVQQYLFKIMHEILKNSEEEDDANSVYTKALNILTRKKQKEISNYLESIVNLMSETANKKKLLDFL